MSRLAVCVTSMRAAMRGAVWVLGLAVLGWAVRGDEAGPDLMYRGDGMKNEAAHGGGPEGGVRANPTDDAGFVEVDRMLIDLGLTVTRRRLHALSATAREYAARNMLRYHVLHAGVDDEEAAGLEMDASGVLLIHDVFAVGNNASSSPPAARAEEEEEEVSRRRRRAPRTVDGVPIHHSNGGSAHVLYLDFTGHAHVNTDPWARGWESFVARPFSLDADAGSLSATEADFISETWARVAEDFYPWTVDVTTEEPGAWTATTGRVLVTSARQSGGAWMPYGDTSGGVAWLGVFGEPDLMAMQIALVYYDNLLYTAANTAEAASHEFGHNLGLSHHGRFGSTYFGGDAGSGAEDAPTSWGPIMGTGYDTHVSQWSDGDYAGATNPDQDDVGVVGRRLVARTDAVGDTRAAASAVTMESDTGFRAEGAILTRGDVDVWYVDVAEGPLYVSAVGYRAPRDTHGGNLDIRVVVSTGDGTVLMEANPGAQTWVDVALASVPAGRLYIAVDGVGAPATGSLMGYTDYASLGQYTLTGDVFPGRDVHHPWPRRRDWHAGEMAAGVFVVVMVAGFAVLVVWLALQQTDPRPVAYARIGTRYASVLRSG